MRFSELLEKDLVQIPISSSDKEEAINELVSLLVKSGRIKDGKNALKAVLARERALSTGVGSGVAVPHATIQGLDVPAVALGRSDDGLEFGALDGNPVHLIFLLLAPEEKLGLHLKLLSRISRLCSNEELRTRLLELSSSDDILEILREAEAQMTEF